jgi:hypothetical protein
MQLDIYACPRKTYAEPDLASWQASKMHERKRLKHPLRHPHPAAFDQQPELFPRNQQLFWCPRPSSTQILHIDSGPWPHRPLLRPATSN